MADETLNSTTSGAALGTAVAPGLGTAIGAGFGFLGGMLSAFGSRKEGQDTARAYIENAKIAERNAKTTILQTYEDTRRQAVLNKKELMATGMRLNRSLSESSVETILREMAINHELDRQTAMYKAGQQAQAFKDEAKGYRTAASNARFAGDFGAAAHTLGAVGGLVEKTTPRPERK